MDSVKLTGLNPKSYHTYADEDLVGLLVSIGESCHPHTLAATGLGKWLAFALSEKGGDE